MYLFIFLLLSAISFVFLLWHFLVNILCTHGFLYYQYAWILFWYQNTFQYSWVTSGYTMVAVSIWYSDIRICFKRTPHSFEWKWYVTSGYTMVVVSICFKVWISLRYNPSTRKHVLYIVSFSVGSACIFSNFIENFTFMRLFSWCFCHVKIGRKNFDYLCLHFQVEIIYMVWPL